MIIDVHMHLGNFLCNGGMDIASKMIPMPRKFNIQCFEEQILHFNSCELSKKLFEKYDDKYTRSVQERIKAGTYANYMEYAALLRKWTYDLFGDNNVKSYCMPIAPYVTYENLYQYEKINSHFFAFTSINPVLSLNEIITEIETCMAECHGLKLHPIIQGISFDSNLTFSVLDLFRLSGKPVLFHAGASRYYLGNERYKQHCDLDNPQAALKMVKRYNDIPFIIGHAGIAEYEEWGKLFKSFDNVFFDITVQSVSSIRKLISIYGEDKMLFATDWPCVNPKTTLKIVKKALSDVQLEKCMFKNAQQSLNM